MLDSEFKRQRAQVLRELVEKTNDPFIKRRLLALISRYDDGVSCLKQEGNSFVVSLAEQNL